MNKNIKWLSNLLLLAIALVMVPNYAMAAGCPSDIKSVTNNDANVPIKVLAQLVMPLTKCELEAEAKAWILLLQKKLQK